MAYDLIVIGGGHNGLATAALAAGRHKRVLVLERNDRLGGLAAGREFHPGYRSIGLLHDTSGVRTSVVEALALGGHGLRREAARPRVFVPQEDGQGLVLDPDPATAAAELDAHCQGDGARYADYRAFLDKVGDYVRSILRDPPPSIAPRGVGQFVEIFKKGWALRGLGQETMYECLRVGPMSVWDWLDERFSGDLVKAALAAPGLIGTWCGPRSAGTTALAMMHECVAQPDVIGGPAALVDALTKACAARNVEVRTSTGVRRILLEGTAVRGVELEDGTVIEGGRVASSVDPQQTFLHLLRPVELPGDLGPAIRNWRMRGTTAKVDLALDGALEFTGRPGEAFPAIRVCESLEAFERAFDPVKYRELPTCPHLDVRVPTLADPSLAPAGHHVVSALVHFVPHDLEGGWTDARRQELLETCVDRLAAVAPTVRDRIVGHAVTTPADIQADLSITGGHVHHGEHGLDQMLSLRPHARCARGTTPIAGLYLCGSGSHPGGGISCAPAERAAAAMR